MNKNIYVFDMEANGLNPDKIYCLCVKNLHTKEEFETTDYSQMRKFFEHADVIICHNLIRFDIPVFERILNIKIKCQLIDTLALSWYLFPDRHVHGLELWGETLGVQKPVIEDWHNLTIEDYLHRCREDVRINFKLWELQWEHLYKLYDGDLNLIEKFLRYIEFKMSCIAQQEKHKWLVDREWAEKVLNEYIQIKNHKVEILKKLLPEVPVYKVKSKPKRYYKKDGTLTADALKWLSLLNQEGCSPDHEDDVKYIIGYEEPNPLSSAQIKGWLFSLGWQPSDFKYDKDKITGKLREIPQVKNTTGELSESVRELIEKEPAIQELDTLSVLGHRIPQIKTHLEQLDERNYTYAGMAGFTNTLRLKHAVLVNMPKPEKPFSDGIRGSLICESDELLCGSDLSGLEDTIKQHFIYIYDPEYVKSMQREDYDPHLSLALLADAITKEQYDNYVSGEDKSIKPIRSIYKNGNYACQYGAFPKRIKLTTNCDDETAQKIFDAYWEMNWAIKKTASDQIVIERNNQQWLVNPFNQFRYNLRDKKDIFSTLVQGTASYIFDKWLYNKLTDPRFKYELLGQFHDEFIDRIPDTEKDKNLITEIIKDSLHRVNAELKFNVEIKCDIQFGKRYNEIH